MEFLFTVVKTDNGYRIYDIHNSNFKEATLENIEKIPHVRCECEGEKAQRDAVAMMLEKIAKQIRTKEGPWS